MNNQKTSTPGENTIKESIEIHLLGTLSGIDHAVALIKKLKSPHHDGNALLLLEAKRQIKLTLNRSYDRLARERAGV